MSLWIYQIICIYKCICVSGCEINPFLYMQICMYLNVVLPLSLLPTSPTSTTLPCPLLDAIQRQLVPLLPGEQEQRVVAVGSHQYLRPCVCVCVYVCVCVSVCVFGCIKQTHEYILYIYTHILTHIWREAKRGGQRETERERARVCVCVWSHIDLFVCFGVCCSVAVCCRVCWCLLQYILQCVEV